MKKGIVALFAAVLLVFAAGCSPQGTDKNVDYEIALIASADSVEDGSFNQAVWRGIETFVEEEPVSYKSYLAPEDTTDAYLRVIEEAVKEGGKIIITTGPTFGSAVGQAQEEYPEVSFLMVDGQPQEEDGSAAALGKNTLSLLFSEEEAGYLAGYAAVKEGYRSLGFMGGKAYDSVQKFGYGFIQGADQAAQDTGAEDISLRYVYTDTFEQDDQVQQKASDWYKQDTEVIFACAGGAGKSVMKAAEQEKGRVIGVDTDQSQESDTVVISAVKNLDESVGDILSTYYGADEFAGGQTVHLTAENGGIGLSIDSSRMETFTARDYDEVFRELAEQQVSVKTEGIKDAKDLETGRVKVEVEEL